MMIVNLFIDQGGVQGGSTTNGRRLPESS